MIFYLFLIPSALVLFFLLFFSRGVLIFLTLFCLETAGVRFEELSRMALQFRWVFFALFCFHILGDIFLGRTVRRIKTFDVLAIVFIIYAFLSSFYSPYPNLTLERATTILALYISVFWVTWKYAYDQSPEKVVRILLQTITPFFIAGYLMIFIGPARPFLFGRFAGIFQNPNALGIISAIILPLSLWRFLETKKKSALFLFLLILVGLILSGARGSLNATFVALAYFIYARSKKYRPLVFFSAASFILILTWIIDTLAKEFFMLYIRAETIPILGGRLEIWPIALDLIKDKPIFGYGFGVEERVTALKYIMLSKYAGSYVHNSYLGMLLQLGMVGFLIFFIPLFILLFKELFLKPTEGNVSLLRYALRASVIAGLICCIYESWLYSVGNSQTLPFWIIVMLLIFYRYQDKEKIISPTLKHDGS